MTNYEYILSECKKAHYGKWEDAAVESCIEKLRGLTREELLRLFTSRWLSKKCKVHEAVFGLLFVSKRYRDKQHVLMMISKKLSHPSLLT